MAKELKRKEVTTIKMFEWKDSKHSKDADDESGMPNLSLWNAITVVVSGHLHKSTHKQLEQLQSLPLLVHILVYDKSL